MLAYQLHMAMGGKVIAVTNEMESIWKRDQAKLRRRKIQISSIVLTKPSFGDDYYFTILLLVESCDSYSMNKINQFLFADILNDFNH